MSDESNESSLLATIVWWMSAIPLLYIGIFVVLMVDGKMLDSMLWKIVPDSIQETLLFVYEPLLRLRRGL